MPYRRLPNTNQARLRSLQQAVTMGNTADIYDLAFSYKLWEEAKALLIRYKAALTESKICSENQFSKSKGLQESSKMARLYISHFIQVLNMCVQRNEIKAELKLLYGLEPDNFTLPDLNSDENLINWGKKIIEGEQQRIMKGGTPIYNPGIGKVRVYYEIFSENYNDQKVLQNSTLRCSENISKLNKNADALILNIWDEIEKRYDSLPPHEKINSCREYGIIYYYRKGEKEPTGKELTDVPTPTIA